MGGRTMAVNRSDIVKMASNKTGMDAEEVDRVLTAALEAVSLSLAAGEPVNIRRFGKFEPRQRNAVTRTNPRTGLVMDIPEKTSVGFVPSVNLKERLNA